MTLDRSVIAVPVLLLFLCSCPYLCYCGSHCGTLAHFCPSVQVIYTYDVKWETSELTWSHRWDVYLKGNPDDEIHYFSIVNSLMIVLFLTGVVAMIMLRTLHKVGTFLCGCCVCVGNVPYQI
jgi:hypothetical protein